MCYSLVMRRFFFLLSCTLFAVPFIVLAASLDDLATDAQKFDEVLDHAILEEQTNSADALREAGEELFPAVVAGSGSSSSRREVMEEDPVYVTARVDGYPVVFTDLPKAEWFAPYVREVINQSIVSGYRDAGGLPKGLFGPADAVTIEQLAKIAVQVAHVDSAGCSSSLKNASAEDRWSEVFIRCAEQWGWAVFADGSVIVDQPATRAQVVATILQAFGVKYDQRTGTVFSDVDGSVEFANAIETAANDGIVSGYADAEGNATGLFKPLDPVNRAEVAKIVTIALQVYGAN